MPDWLATLLLVAGSVVTFAAFLRLGWQHVVRPLMRGFERLMQVLEQIREASGGVQRLAREVEALAGALANFVIGIKDQVDKNTERLDQLEELRELVVDLSADVERVLRHINSQEGSP